MTPQPPRKMLAPRKALATAVASAMLLLGVPRDAGAGASDVSLFVGGGNVAPNILILLDSSGSMDDMTQADQAAGCVACPSKRTIAKDALDTLVRAVNPPDGAGGFIENARFGLFFFRDNGGDLVAPIADGNTQAVLDAAAAQVASSVGTPIAGSLVDMARYYASPGAWGTMPAWGTLAGEAVQASPFDLPCRKSFIIYISDGLPSGDSVDRAGFWASIGDADNDDGVGEGAAENDSLTVTSSAIEWADDVAYALYNRDFMPGEAGTQNVVTHVIGLDIDTPILQRIATNGQGIYRTAGNANQLANALIGATLAVFDSLASFSSAAVPASRTLSGSSFYNAFFEPKVNDPFWEGHLEAYKLSPAGEILDAANQPAVDPVTFELVDPHNPVWDAGIVLRSDNFRNIYTNKAGLRLDFDTANVLQADLGVVAADIPFYPNSAASGVDTVAELTTAVIDYVHGKDAFDEDGDANNLDMRGKVLGDTFHSSPRIVSRPTSLLSREAGYPGFRTAYSGRERVIYVGANDGLLHAFDAGDPGDNPATPQVETDWYDDGDGHELFGYAPESLLPTLKMIPRNNPRTYYYVDGSPIVAEAWLGDGTANDISRTSDEWATVLVVGMREGGESYLALDITNPQAGGADLHGPYPKLLWEFTHAKLGQTWSEPVITRVKLQGSAGSGDHCGYDDTDGDCREKWVAIFGGGYDQAADPNTVAYVPEGDAAWDDKSKAIFIVDLHTGNVIASVEYDGAGITGPSDMEYAIPSAPAVLDFDFDGFADVIYIGDLGGQMWKWDIKSVGVDSGGDSRVDNWQADVFFEAPDQLMGDGTTHYRSFFFPPSAALVNGVLTMAFGSGEREQLRYPGVVGVDDNNRLYVVEDPHPTGPMAFGIPLVEGDLTNVTNVDIDPDPTDSGFYLIADEGEKFISNVIIFAGYVLTASFQASTVDPCVSANGEGFFYALSVRSGAGLGMAPAVPPDEARKTSIGGGLPSTPKVSLAPDPENDQVYVKTSKGKILTLDPPDRGDSGSQIIYWKQNF